jgi:ABC-type bacteriocin/lantibiotic exporter with double-glycine peptidase domain
VLIEYTVILVIVYLISRFILFPILEKQITREERHRENRARHTREIIDNIEDIKQIL